MKLAPTTGAGLRRYDAAAARADEYGRAFAGLADDLRHGQVLALLKRAAPYLGIKARLLSFVDTLFAFTKGLDWQAGQTPIVFPSNEKLSRKLNLSIRQVQNLSRGCVEFGLITFTDSPNGVRQGRRGKNGYLMWAYGINLAPIGARVAEWRQIAVEGEALDARLARLHSRYDAARRRLREMIPGAVAAGIEADEYGTELIHADADRKRLKASRDEAATAERVEQLESRIADFARLFAEQEAPAAPEESSNISPQDEANCASIQTTTELEEAYADLCNGYPKGGSAIRRRALLATVARSAIEDDLEKYRVDARFIQEATPELPWPATGQAPTPLDIFTMAERLTRQADVSASAWREAQQIMGRDGAAAAGIAACYKMMRRDVERPGGYIRAMSKRAMTGELHLGRTFHGFKETAGCAAMRALGAGNDPSSLSQLTLRYMAQARAKVGLA